MITEGNHAWWNLEQNMAYRNLQAGAAWGNPSCFFDTKGFDERNTP